MYVESICRVKLCHREAIFYPVVEGSVSQSIAIRSIWYNVDGYQLVQFDDQRLVDVIDCDASCSFPIKLRLGQAFSFGLGTTMREQSFTKTDILRWKRVRAAVESIDGEIRSVQPYLPQPYHWRYPGERWHKGFECSSGNIHDLDRIGDGIFMPCEAYKEPLHCLPLIATGLNGGIHLAAINFEFATFLESLLWKISAALVSSSVPLVAAMCFLGDSYRWDWIPKWVEYVSLTVFLPFIILLPRAYLIIESFASLRAAPIGVYWTPSWLQMIPHV